MLSIIIIHHSYSGLEDCIGRALIHGTSESEIIVVNVSGKPVHCSFNSKRLRIMYAPNVGYSYAINQGVMAAKNDLLVVMNDDVLLTGITLDFVHHFSNTDAGIAGCRVLNEDGSLQSSMRQFPSMSQMVMQLTFLNKLKALSCFKFSDHYYNHMAAVAYPDWVKGCFMVIKRKCWEELGGFDEDFFLFAEETDFCRRAANAGWRTAYYGNSLVRHIGRASIGGGHLKTYAESNLRYHRKHTKLYGLYVRLFCKVFRLKAVIYGLLGKQDRRNMFNIFHQVYKEELNGIYR